MSQIKTINDNNNTNSNNNNNNSNYNNNDNNINSNIFIPKKTNDIRFFITSE